MLVCSVSQLQRRAGIAADIAETTTALDAPGTGNVVLAALVDDPASVREQVDAFLGQIMREAASAAATVNAGLVYAVRVDEAVTSTELYSGAVPTALSVTMAEVATATTTQDATLAAPARSAMIPGAFVNPSTARQANVAGIMVNL